MNYLKILALMIAIVSCSSFAAAEESVRGYLISIKNDRLTVTVPKEGERTFTVTGATSVLNVSELLTLNRIPRHSVVQVVERNGIAEVVIVEVMPK